MCTDIEMRDKELRPNNETDFVRIGHAFLNEVYLDLINTSCVLWHVMLMLLLTVSKDLDLSFKHMTQLKC